MNYDNLNSTGDQLSEAIWEAAWFAVNKTVYSKAEFVEMVTRAAGEAFDSQMHNVAVRSTAIEPPTVKPIGRAEK